MMEDVSHQMNFLSLKEDGNKAYKEGELETSLTLYENALKVAGNDHEKAIILRNEAAVYLKLSDYENVLRKTTQVLDLYPNDAKALYRKSQALEQLDKVEEAYQNAKQLLTVDPNDKETQLILQRLYEKVQKRVEYYNDINVKVTKMLTYAFDFNEHFEKREKALNNILILSRESAVCDALCNAGVVAKISSLIKVEKNKQLYSICIQIISELCRNNEQRTKNMISELGIPWFFELMNHKDLSCVCSGQYCFQTILNSLIGLDHKNTDSKPDQNLYNKNKKEVDTIFTCLLCACKAHSVSGMMRDSVIKLITRNVHYEILDWAHKFVETNGLQYLMEVASEMSEYKYESCMEITDSTKTLVSVCLARIYDNMYYDQARKEYLDSISEFIKECLLMPEIESKVRVTVAITVLLQGPLDIGNTIIAKEGILEMILVMAGADDLIQQKVACECIVAAITKQDKAQAILSKGIDILKKLYKSEHDSIRIRALVGLCKVGSSGGTDASIKPLAEGSNKNLAIACRKFLVRSADNDTKFWAAEGLSFLTLDAEIKEFLVRDLAALNALIDIAKLGNMSSVYGIVTTFVNLCNAYEKEEILPEMIELAKFAKRHVPETHEFDKEEYIVKRILLLGKHGTASALVSLSKTESHNCKELISRVFNTLCGQQELRGIVVQQGGVKALLALSLEGTSNGIKYAAQALARIGITINPQIAFSGERCIEVIRPLLALLLPECSGLMNFEALMALCNIASMGEKTCSHILKENGFSKIESYMYEDHIMLRRAATQCITNLVNHPNVIKIFEGENDRFKFLYILSADEDIETSKAAAGAIAILTEISEKCCNKIFSIKEWSDIMKQLLANPDKEVQHRGVVITYNVVCSNKNNADQLMNTDIIEILMALSVIPGDDFTKIRNIVMECLKTAQSLNIIKPSNS